MHPGDCRKLSVVYPEPLLESFRGVDPSRSHTIFFSTLGQRSEADQIAGSDYDGDQFVIIGWQKLVRLFVNQSPPYDAKAMTGACSQTQGSAVGTAVRGRPAAATHAGGRGINGHSSVLRNGARFGKAAVVEGPPIEQKLVANFIMARFLSGAVVGTAGTQWMVFADKYGANSKQCLKVSPIPATLRSEHGSV